MSSLLTILLTFFRVAFIGDPQVDNEQELSYARASIYQELKQRKDIDLVVVLGDLVNDNPSLLAPSKAALDSLPCPWICAPGNHDRDVYRGQKGRKRDNATFRATMGYVDTTFVMKGVRFISMDDVNNSDREYRGAFRPSQRHWLDSVLSVTPKEMKTIICTHIPLNEFESKDSLAAMFRGRPNLISVSGHTHYVMRQPLTLSDDVTIDEIGVGATCGTWWRGVKGEDGIPYALMNCGAPRGYFIMDVRRGRPKNWYTLDYKSVNRPSEDRFSVAVKDGKLYVNVYGGSVDGVVTAKIKGETYTLEVGKTVALEAIEVDEYNKSKDKAYRRAHKDEFIPILRHKSPHVWTMDIPDSIKDLKINDIRVNYRDSHMKIKK